MKTVFALLTALMALGCLPKDQGAPLAQALVEAPIVAPSPRPPLAIEPSVARVMPDQLATTAAMTFSMDERDLDRVVGSPRDVQALGGLPFGTTGLAIQYRPTFGLTLFIARAFDRESPNSEDSNGFCGSRGAIAQVSAPTPQDRVRDLALLLWGEAPQEEEVDQWVALGASASQSGVPELEGICVGMLHEARFVTY